MGKGYGGMPDGVKTSIGWALGIGVIALIVIIMLILFGNLSGNYGFSGRDSTSFSNETVTLSTAGVTPTTAQGRVNGELSNVIVYNSTSGVIVPAGNYTISGVLIRNATKDYGEQSVNITATVIYDNEMRKNADGVITNYSKSATNLSQQFPTVGTIVGVALLLVVLIGILVFAIRKMMGVAGGSSSNSSKNNGSFERGGFG